MALDPPEMPQPQPRRRVVRAWLCPQPNQIRGVDQTTEVIDLSTALRRANALIRAGERDAAATLLASYLDPLDVDALPADTALIDAFTLYATLLTSEQQISAARYAATASSRLHTPRHPRRRLALQVLGTALQQHGQFTEAIAVRRELLTANRQAGDQVAVLDAQRQLAESLHAAGRCDEAAHSINRAWQEWRRQPASLGGLITGAALLHAYSLVLRGCRRDLELVTLLLHAHTSGALHALATTRRPGSANTDRRYLITHRSTVCTGRPTLHTSHQPGHRQRPASADRGPETVHHSADPAPQSPPYNSPNNQRLPRRARLRRLTQLLNVVISACSPTTWRRTVPDGPTQPPPASQHTGTTAAHPR